MKPRLTYLQIAMIVFLFGAIAFLLFGLFVFDAQGEEPAKPPPLAERLYAILLKTPVAPPPEDRPETDADLHERLHEIAEDAADAAHGDASDALLALAVAEEESHFAADIDKGPCRPGTCDNGRAACMLQIWGRDNDERVKLFTERRYCFAKGVRLLRGSEQACMGDGRTKEHRFARYAAGTCDSLAGQKGSERLADYVERWRVRWRAEIAAEPHR